jgi:hypothetical protein
MRDKHAMVNVVPAGKTASGPASSGENQVEEPRDGNPSVNDDEKDLNVRFVSPG